MFHSIHASVLWRKHPDESLQDVRMYLTCYLWDHHSEEMALFGKSVKRSIHFPLLPTLFYLCFRFCYTHHMEPWHVTPDFGCRLPCVLDAQKSLCLNRAGRRGQVKQEKSIVTKELAYDSGYWGSIPSSVNLPVKMCHSLCSSIPCF